MKIVVGIGNPGPEYVGTRHNVGFDVVDLVADQHNLPRPTGARFHSHVQAGVVGDERILLVKPQTYVNGSGLAVRQFVNWYKETPESLLVVCDDLNLPLGRIRARRSGSSGGHKGLQSIADALGTEAVPRLRIGIGTDAPVADAVAFVLSRFRVEEQDVIRSAIEQADRAVSCWIAHGIDRCMNEFNPA